MAISFSCFKSLLKRYSLIEAYPGHLLKNLPDFVLSDVVVGV